MEAITFEMCLFYCQYLYWEKHRSSLNTRLSAKPAFLSALSILNYPTLDHISAHDVQDVNTGVHSCTLS